MNIESTRLAASTKPASPRRRLAALALAALLAAAPAVAQAPPPIALERVEIVRDPQGVPHVFAKTDRGACHGAGYAAACDRLFQMEFFRRSMRGTLREIFPANPYDLALDADKRARTIGWARYADELLQNPAFDANTRSLLTSYAAGVNARLAELRNGPASGWPRMFQNLGVAAMADWVAADCVLVWMFAQDVFGAASWNDLTSATSTLPTLDLGAAVLPDLGNSLFARAEAGRRPRGAVIPAPEMPVKASHNLVVHGSATTTDKPIMLAKPQHRLMSPTWYYEYAMRAAQGAFDCRGAGLPGCPAFFHGWNRFLAWSLTSLSVDIADVYQVAFADAQHTSYAVATPQGPSVLAVEEFAETIHQVGGPSLPWRHRRTIWGPLVSEFLHCGSIGCIAANDPEHAVRSLVFDDVRLRAKHSITGSLMLMRARSKTELVAASREWRSPAGHMLVATTDGDIGYRALTGLPLRPANQVRPGLDVLDGNTIASDWPGEVLFTQLPACFGAGTTYAAGGKPYLSTANNLACDPALLPQPFQLGQPGDTVRSWRLRELLAAALPTTTSRVGVADVLAMDHDAVQPLLRTFVRLAREIQVDDPAFFSANAVTVLANVSSWSAPWAIDDAVPATVYQHLMAIADSLDSFGPGDPTWEILVTTYGARTHSIIKMLRPLAGVEHRYAQLFGAHTGALKNWVQSELVDSFATLQNKQFPPATDCRMGHQDNYRRLRSAATTDRPSNWPALDVVVGDLHSANIGTIWAQGGETYKFLADFSAGYPDHNRALLPAGVSENPDDAALYLNHQADWRSGQMPVAPITRGTFVETPVRILFVP